MAFRSFQTRLLAAFLALFAGVLGATLLLVNAANTRNARAQVEDALEIGAGVFRRLTTDRTERLIEAARLLSGDFAFKSAYATGERATVLSALENHRSRIGADVMLLASLDYEVLADTRAGSAGVGRLPLAGRIDAALERGDYEVVSIAFLDGTAYQLVVVPLLVPVPDAWICVGFRIDDAYAQAFRRLTLSHVSLLAQQDSGPSLPLASTLGAAQRAALPAALAAVEVRPDRSAHVELLGESFVTLVTALGERGDAPVLAVLQRSLTEALRPYLRLRRVLLVVFVCALAATLLLGTRIARSVSRPVLRVAEGARRVEQGDYAVRLEARGEDEIGRLARSFNHMAQGLEERDRVRDLLGKVVSPAVAGELMKSPIDLGGTEREVTVLFSDIRGFTTWSEGLAPAQVLARLNTYLTAMSAEIDAAGGVVDKYVGDAIMALFGAPVQHNDDATRAVQAALGMRRALEALNARLRAEAVPEIRIGIGINTAVVVAGNMGSPTRLNYSVIGDGVNVAARIEGLTKVYDVPVLVSEMTRQAGGGFVYREVDRVRVKGRDEPLTIHEPLAAVGELSAEAGMRVERFERALACYRGRDWAAARTGFQNLLQGSDHGLAALFLERIERLVITPPGSEWDGTFTHQTK